MSEDNVASSETGTYDILKVLKALPHRYPLLLVDRVGASVIGQPEFWSRFRGSSI